MKFSVKSAGQYSNVLSQMIAQFSIDGYDAEKEGLVKVTEIAQKSKIKTGKEEMVYEDEVKEKTPVRPIAKLDPMKRMLIILDLVEEKNKIDYEINKAKQGLTIMSPFSNTEIGVDLAMKENALYRRTAMLNLENMLDVEEGEIEQTRKMSLLVDGVNMTFEYPFIIKKESLVDEGKVNELYEELHTKTQEASDLIDKALSSSTLEFENKFPLFKNIDKVIKMYE